MKNLANIYLYNISSYFELIELYNFKNTCKLFNKEFIDKFNKLFLNNKININNFFSKQIISLFGGENIMEKCILNDLKDALTLIGLGDANIFKNI